MNIKDKIDMAINNGHDVWIAGNVPLATVKNLENIIAVTLPLSLKTFLIEFGALGIYDNFLSGICSPDALEHSGGNIFADTMFLREEYPDLPMNLWVLQLHQDGAYCLDISKELNDREFAIVNFEYGKSTVIYHSYLELIDSFLAPWLEIS